MPRGGTAHSGLGPPTIKKMPCRPAYRPITYFTNQKTEVQRDEALNSRSLDFSLPSALQAILIIYSRNIYVRHRLSPPDLTLGFLWDVVICRVCLNLQGFLNRNEEKRGEVGVGLLE